MPTMSGTGYGALGAGLHSAADAVRDFYKMSRQKELDDEDKRRFNEEQKNRLAQTAIQQSLADIEGKQFGLQEREFTEAQNDRGLKRYESAIERMGPDVEVEPEFADLPKRFGADPRMYSRQKQMYQGLQGDDSMETPEATRTASVTRDMRTFAERDKTGTDKYYMGREADYHDAMARAAMANALNNNSYSAERERSYIRDDVRMGINTQMSQIRPQMDRLKQVIERRFGLENITDPGAWRDRLAADPSYVRLAETMQRLQRKLQKSYEPGITDQELNILFPLDLNPLTVQSQQGVGVDDPVNRFLGPR